MEQKRRSIAKALSWRFVATVITSVVVYALTGKWEFALTVGFLDTTIKLLAYYFHERMWVRISFGKGPKTDDFQI